MTDYTEAVDCKFSYFNILKEGNDSESTRTKILGKKKNGRNENENKKLDY